MSTFQDQLDARRNAHAATREAMREAIRGFAISVSDMAERLDDMTSTDLARAMERLGRDFRKMEGSADVQAFHESRAMIDALLALRNAAYQTGTADCIFDE